MIDPKFFQVVAQLSHFAWGALVVTWVAILCPHDFFCIWIGLEAVAAVKEFWYDYRFENTETRGSSLLDFSIYTLGASVGCLALFWKGMI